MDFFLFLHKHINVYLLQTLNNLTKYDYIANIVYFMSDAPIFILPIFLLWYWIYFNYKKDINWKNKLLFIFYSTIIAIIISLIIQQFVSIERPEKSLISAWKMILQHIPDASFPSDHASVSSAFLISLFFFDFKKIAKILTPFFIIMLLSRIAWGVHWPLDIFIWCLVWFLSSFIIYKSRNLDIFTKINNFIMKLSSYFKL